MATIQPHALESFEGRQNDVQNAVFKPEDYDNFRSSRPQNLALETQRLSSGDNAILPAMPGLELVSDRRYVNFQSDLPSRAASYVDQKLWQRTPYKDIVGNGDYGCAASLGYFLNRNGVNVEPSPLAVGLKNNLQRIGWRADHNLAGAEVGSVIYGNKIGRQANKGGGAGHIAIVVGRSNGQLMVADNNADAGGTWSIRPLSESFKQERYDYSRLTVLHPAARRGK